MEKTRVAAGIYWVSIPGADLRILCGCPADAVKHLMKSGLIRSLQKGQVVWETGPNAILLSDVAVQNGAFSNLAEFPVLQMLYRQGMMVPGHPGNTGKRPMLIGLEEQVLSQSQYIYRGNYGLVTEEEIVATGVPEAQAHEMMRCKKWFAFDSIRPTEDLLELRAVDGTAVVLRDGVFVHRKGVNRYEFLHGGESVEVDLNLASDEEYESAFRLGTPAVRREYFSVIHSGEGDGWDTSRPCMGSILCFQGRLFLVDAGPNLRQSLAALGIDMNEIQGVFHTHAHDDHFAGLTSLVRAGRKLSYFATPFVRASMERKLEALTGMRRGEFARFLEIHDLVPEEWNSYEGLEIRPVWSPHPVETTVFFFRALGENGYKSYAHLADMVSFDVLRKMVTDDPARSGVSPAFAQRYMDSVRAPVDLKKIDAGSGLIHGSAKDFAGDPSGKLVLSHSALPFTDAEREIGCEARFGATDVLLPAGHQTIYVQTALQFLEEYFPGAQRHDLALLANCPIVGFAAGSLMIRRGVVNADLYLLLSGTADMLDPSQNVHNQLSAGAIIGELSGIAGEAARRTYRSQSDLVALKVPCGLYREFIRRNHYAETLLKVQEKRQSLQNSPLFGELVSFSFQHRIAQLMKEVSAAEGQDVAVSADELAFLLQGEVSLFTDGRLIERIGAGGFWGEAGVLGEGAELLQVRAHSACTYAVVPGSVLADIPIVQWKLQETHRRRLLGFRAHFRFEWKEAYAVGVRQIDDQHQRLFTMINALAELRQTSAGHAERLRLLGEIVPFTRLHFDTEETLMRTHGYPELERHRSEHEQLLASAQKAQSDPPSEPGSLASFLKDWLVDHTLQEDRKLGPFLNSRGVR